LIDHSLKKTVEHIDITKYDVTDLVNELKATSFTSREIYNACQLYKQMLEEEELTVILTIAGSTQAAGCLKLYRDLVRFNMVDIIVATGASIIDMDLFEGLGNKHYIGSCKADDNILREEFIDRIYDTFISEDDLKQVDNFIAEFANKISDTTMSSREFLNKLGWHLRTSNSLVQECYKEDVPIFCPALNDSAAGSGLLMHQTNNPDSHLVIDSIKDLRELTYLKVEMQNTGLFMVGGGVPKNFAQDIVVAAESIGHRVPMHQYAIQLTVADVRDGACSSSTLDEASSWGKVDNSNTQMVYGEATSTLPIIANYAYNNVNLENRKRRKLHELFGS
jgi:deoxyhypusine synthase